MAAFACFSSVNEKTTANYKDLVHRLKENTKRLEYKFSLIPNPIFGYYSPHKITHFYKDFIYQLRKTEFKEVYVILCENPSCELKNLVRYIEETKLLDGLHACNYYGEIKRIITSFLSYFTQIIDDVVRKIDEYSHKINNNSLVALIDDTIKMNELSQEAFIREYLPIKSAIEQKQYDEIVNEKAIYIEKLTQLRETWAGCRQDQLEDFVKEYIEPSLKKTNEICNFAHTYISMMLGDRVAAIAISIGEILDRIKTNTRVYEDHCHRKTHHLIQHLYEKNKESLQINRREIRRPTDTAEIYKTIEVLQDKIEHFGNEETDARLEAETWHWMKTLIDFNDIASTLSNLRFDADRMIEEEATYRRLRYGNQYSTDRIHYTDKIGSYYCDEYNHQNYIHQHGLKYFHVNCYGDLIENVDTEPYYFDENGRYTKRNDKKLHQCAPCTSQYEFGVDGLFRKITKDCGHSEKINEHCRVQIKDLADVVILPKRDIIDISGTLDGDATKYLWENFGMIVPDVLCTVAMEQPKNPIHYMAHLLLKRRFEATQADLQKQRKQATEYRSKIYKERKDKAAAASRKWKSKLVKRRKPEESDDSQEWAAYGKHIANWQYVNSLGYYN